jgi:putative peptidoglycan lipid II flippase
MSPVRSILGVAALITALTVLSRITGFARNLVLARTVGFNCLSDAYTTINTVPNVLYEVVAGGALASLVVPLLAAAVDRGDRETVNRTASALLTWTMLVLVPLMLVVLALSGPIAFALLGGKGCGGSVAVATDMLRIFAPQVVLYGVGVVLVGVLQAHHRFVGPSIAPILSSVVVIAAFVTYASLVPGSTDVDTLTTNELWVLAGGTTLGVVALSLPLLVPLARCGVRLRPTFRFPLGLSVGARSLALAGVATLVAQQLSVVVALRLSNSEGAPSGTAAAYFQAQTMFFLPYAILAMPLATSIFPRLAAALGRGDHESYRRDLSASVRVVLLLCLAATAVLVTTAGPVARVIAQSAPGVPSVVPIQHGITTFAIGLTGFGLFAVLSRALYASQRGRAAGAAIVVGWLAVGAADVMLVRLADDEDRVAALGLGNSVGMLVMVTGLLLAVRWTGRDALVGFSRTLLVAVAAAIPAVGAGLLAGRLVGDGGVLAAFLEGTAIGALTLAVFAALCWALARRDLADALSTLRARDDDRDPAPATPGPDAVG